MWCQWLGECGLVQGSWEVVSWHLHEISIRLPNQILYQKEMWLGITLNNSRFKYNSAMIQCLIKKNLVCGANFYLFCDVYKKCVKFLRPLRGAFKCNNILKLKKISSKIFGDRGYKTRGHGQWKMGTGVAGGVLFPGPQLWCQRGRGSCGVSHLDRPTHVSRQPKSSSAKLMWD